MNKVSRVGGVSSPEVLKVLEWFKSQLGGVFQIVDFWVNEDKTQWYRKWSNGFIECGGRYDNGSVVHDFATTITFPVTFTELPFVLCTAARGTNSDMAFTGCVGEFTTTSAYMQMWDAGGGARYLHWYACGY